MTVARKYDEDLTRKIEETGETIIPRIEELRGHIKQLKAAGTILKGAAASVEAIMELLPLINLERLMDERDFLVEEAKTYRKKYLDLIDELGGAVTQHEALSKHLPEKK
jgi:hypothetical protein